MKTLQHSLTRLKLCIVIVTLVPIFSLFWQAALNVVIDLNRAIQKEGRHIVIILSVRRLIPRIEGALRIDHGESLHVVWKVVVELACVVSQRLIRIQMQLTSKIVQESMHPLIRPCSSRPLYLFQLISIRF